MYIDAIDNAKHLHGVNIAFPRAETLLIGAASNSGEDDKAEGICSRTLLLADPC